MKHNLIIILFLILFSCKSDDYEDCDSSFSKIYRGGFCENCETFPGRKVKINFLEKDTSIFKYNLGDSIVFLFQDSAQNKDTIIYVCSYKETFSGSAISEAYLSRCINLVEADNQEIIFTPDKPYHDLLKIKLVAHHNEGVFFISFLNSNVDGRLNVLGNSNYLNYFDNFVYNSIIYKSLNLFNTRDLNNKSVSYYLNIKNNFCLIAREDSTYYQKIN